MDGGRVLAPVWNALLKNDPEPVLKQSFIRRSSPPGYKSRMTVHCAVAVRCLALLGVLACAQPLWAHGHADHDLARQALEQGRVLPLRTVLDKIERDHPGRVLKIEFEEDDGRFVYEIRLLQRDGRMAKLKVDAVDGRVLKIKRKEQEGNGDAHPGRGR